MICKALESMGLFVGYRKDVNHEAQFFLRLNDWMMVQSGGAWDYPAPAIAMLEDDVIRSALRDYALKLLSSPRFASYLGVKNVLLGRGANNMPVPWGWKDPRNTFLLPIWGEIFPDAKYIHVMRHGCDVADSLKARSDRTKPTLPYHLNRRYSKFLPLPPRRRPVARWISARISTHAGALSLWSEYMDQATQMEEIYKSRTFSLRYEEFLEEPLSFLPKLASFVSLPPREELNQEIANTIDSSRAYSYRKSEELNRLEKESRTTLARHGY
jgi:hypothetical protein